MNVLAMKLPDVGAGDFNVLALAAGAGSPRLYIGAVIAFVVVRGIRWLAPVASTWLTQRGETQRTRETESAQTERARITAETERYRIDAETERHRVTADIEGRRVDAALQLGPDRLRAEQPPEPAVPAARRPRGQEAGRTPATRAS